MYHIYTLTDPRDNQVHYVGMSMDPETRYKSHIALSGVNSKAKDDWIKELLSRGLKPIMQVIDEATTEKEARVLEGYWICQNHLLGAILYNSDVYRSIQYKDSKLTTRLLARASLAKNRPVLTDIARKEVVPQFNKASINMAEHLVRKVAKSLREGCDTEICAIALDQVLDILETL